MIRTPLLDKVLNLRHGFGTKGDEIPPDVVTAKQVHGTRILEVRSSMTGPHEGFDILMTGEKGITVAVKTADCLPILIAETERGIVAAVHAGWRGTVGRVVEKAVERIVSLGGRIDHLVVALGPSMRRDCYEVGSDVADLFEKEFPNWPVLRKKNESKSLLDVAETNRRLLLAAGLKESQIDRIDLCTHCHPDLFHSWRRDGANAGRMVSFVGLL